MSINFLRDFFYNIEGGCFFSLIGGGAAARTDKWTKCCPLPYRLPSGFSANSTIEARSAEFDGTGWTGGRKSNGSFNFFHFKIY